LLTSNGYYDHGTVNTGAIVYAFDQKGNMTARNGQTYLWNEDNRLVEALVSSADPKAFLYSVFYKYDYAGRRILEYKGNSASWWDQAYSGTAQRTRHFFNGLTEEVRKVSVNTHSDTAFGLLIRADGDANHDSSFGTPTYNADRRSNVYYANQSLSRTSGATYFGTGYGLNITGRTTFSAWLRSGHTNPFIRVSVMDTSGNRRGLMYSCQSGSSFTQGNLARIRLGGTSQDFYAPGRWVRLERNLQADLAAMYPGSTLARITGVELATEGIATTIYMDDLRFSNSLTVEKNVLAGGSIGHIVRNRTIDSATYAATDQWFHYDQVGSVMAVSNASGNLQTRVHQDAFGNVLADWTTGQWAIDAASAGWHHNTKEFSDDTGLTYMYQRWYLPEVGVFTSKATIPPYAEDHYTFGLQNPLVQIDPLGTWPRDNNTLKPEMGGAGGKQLYVCIRGSFPGGPIPAGLKGNHTYFWLFGPDGAGVSCGMGNSSGGQGTTHANDRGLGFDQCFLVSSDSTTADAIFNCCQDTANSGMWFPFVNDCHNKVSRCAKGANIDLPRGKINRALLLP
jgi:RHS repeat-associated protein